MRASNDRRTLVRALLAIVSLAVLAAPARARTFEPARSSGPMLTVGLLISAAKRAGDDRWRTGLGGELALVTPFRLSRALPPLILGGFAQLQGIEGFSGSRIAGGARLQLWIFGLDGGVAQQAGDGQFASTAYGVLAPSVQLGPTAVALRVSWPISSGAHYARETALAITLRVPLMLGGPRRRGTEAED